MSRWIKLFGNPTDAMHTILDKNLLYDLLDQCDSCPMFDQERCVENWRTEPCWMDNEEAVLEWLMGDDE